MKAYEKIVKGENIPEPGVPESFKVLLKELQSIGLDVKILNEDQEEVVIKELDDDDDVDTNEDEIKEVMEGSDAVADDTEEANVIEEEPVTSGEDDDVLSTMAMYDQESETDED